MNISTKLLQAAAGSAGGAGLDVDEVFKNFLYVGAGATKIIENGIALSNANDGGSLNGSDSTTGTAQNWINVPASSDFGFGTGDFTIELFFYMKGKKNYNNLIDFRTTNESNNLPAIYVDQTPNLNYFIGGTGSVIAASVAEGQWYHIAVSRSGTSTKMFLNGTQVGSTYTDNTNYVTPTATWSLGAAAAQTAYEVNGYISNVRVVKGTALYTSNFTAPTSALTAVTNTKLLTLQGDTPFVDNSSSSHSLTQNGSPVASEFGPFTGTSGEGGLVWIKERSRSSTPHSFYDTERGARYWLTSNQTYQQYLQPSGKGVTGFNSNGFTLGTDYNGSENANGQDVVSWTFRKAPRFFDIQTWTGNSASDRAISHNLDAVPGMIIVKRLNSSEDWGVWHRDVHANTTKVLYLNKTDALTTSSSIFGATNPTSTNFYVGNHPVSNNNGDTYVAYIFAHNNGDGEFGPDSDQDIIKCGSFTTDGSGNATVNLGFEPQWLMVKSTSNAYGWEIYDQMRGFGVNGHAYLFAHLANAEGNNSTAGTTQPTSTGFSIGNNYWGAGVSLIYMAIRRGPLAEPTDATKVFAIDTAAGTSPSPPHFTSGFPVDFAFYRDKSSTADWYAGSRLNRTKYLKTNATDAETSDSALLYDYQNGFNNANWTSANTYAWMWKRAPGYFDVVAYQGTGSAGFTFNHNLGVKPEMIWVKNRGASEYWAVYHKDLNGGTNPSHYYLKLNDTNAEFDYNEIWNDTEPTATQVTVGQQGVVNSGSFSHIAYLFATVAGVSKVGSYTGNGSSQNIDCGFSSGARFVLIKKSSDSGHWQVYDTARGIVAGNDPRLALNLTSAELTGYDMVDPYSGGFAVTSMNDTNENGYRYIFYAIA